jgi:hypothetical protein
MASLELLVEVLEEANLPVTAGTRAAVAGELDEVEMVEDRQRTRQVGRERDARLEQADEEGLQRVVVGGDLRAELADADRDLVRVEIDVADARIPLDRDQLARSSGTPKCRASRSMSRR